MNASDRRLTRREFFMAMAGLGFTMSTLQTGCEADVKKGVSTASEAEKTVYWGDLHNHNAVGYAKGSLERAYDIAQTHLDFFCFTGHSQWPDMPEMPESPRKTHLQGFEVFRNNWEKVQRLANQNYAPGVFVPFIGYEWHSSQKGDQCIIFPDENAELRYIDDIQELQQFAKSFGAILLPHHPAYLTGWRGANWEVLDTSVSPVLEIFSEHGNAESDLAPYGYDRHSMGGRYTVNTYQWLLEHGVRIGAVANTDDHLGYPGAYGEGLVAVYAEELTRESILQAVKARRTYGVNADRIGLQFSLNGAVMGEEIAASSQRRITVAVDGKSVIDRVEVLRNNRVIHRDHPIDRRINTSSWKKPVICRLEFGWGSGGAVREENIFDWEFSVGIDNGKILGATPCFQSGPFDENRRNKLIPKSENRYVVQSYTSRSNAYEERATNGVILQLEATPETQLTVDMVQPVRMTVTKSLRDLAESSDVAFTGEFTSPSMMFHRIKFSDQYETTFEVEDERQSDSADWYYVRVQQSNGSLAWSSPIWVG